MKGTDASTPHQELISVLNEAISLEYAAVIHYNQHSMLLTGPDKLLYEDLFRHSAEDSLGHAKKWGDRIVYLGGVPTPEIREKPQTLEVAEMLQLSLEIEQKAVDVYSRAHKICKHEPTLYMLEHQIVDEDSDVERIKKLLGRVEVMHARTMKPAA